MRAWHSAQPRSLREPRANAHAIASLGSIAADAQHFRASKELVCSACAAPTGEHVRECGRKANLRSVRQDAMGAVCVRQLQAGTVR